MATLQEIIAKRKELGANATNVDARKALETTQTAPVPANPTPVTPVMDQMAGKTVAERQAIRSGTPAPTPTPPAPTTTPSGATLDANGVVTPTPVTPPAQQVLGKVGMTDQEIIQAGGKVENGVQMMPAKKIEPTKTEAPIDYNKSQGREQEIINNLNTFKAQNMTPEQIMKASGYAEATPEKKALIDPYLKVQTPTASAMYNNIVAKADIPEEMKLTPSYKIAQNRYMKANMYNSMTPSQLSNEMTNSKLIQGSQAYEDLKAMNPKLVQDTENLRIVNGSKNNIWTYVNNPDGTPVKVNNLENTFKEDYMDNFGEFIKSMYKIQTPEEIRAIIYTPDVKDAEDKAKAIELDINKIDDALDQVDKDVETELAGTGATGSRIALEKAIRKDKLNTQRASLERNYTTYANKANNLITQNTSVFQTQQQQKQAQNAAMLPFITDQYKSDFEKKQAQEALNDPYTAIPQIIEEYKKLGIPFTRSTQEIIADFESSGQDLGTYLTGLQKLIQEKPEYQAYKDKQSGTEWQSTSITRYNPATGANESTPIFYRKKTNGEFEAVDLSGNKIDSSLLISGGVSSGTSTPGTLPTSFTGDTTSYIASKEGFRDTAYQDSAGVWTIGYGTTKINGKPIQPGQKITQAEAQKQLDADIAKHSNWKSLIDEKTLSDSQKTALASFEYNLGPGIWNKSAMNIIDMIKSGDLQGAGKEMQKYVNAGGKVVKGLQNRRAEEAQLLQSTGSNIQADNSNPLQIKEFETYDGKTIPAQYKTPLEQDDFVKRYNNWVSSRPGTKIETGDDLLKIKLDKPTGEQTASLAFGGRMINAAKNAEKYEEAFNRLPIQEQLYQAYAPELMTSQNQKSLMREKMDFITAVLRKESGASIAPSEFAAQDKIFFPQPGDGPEILIAKRNARNFRVKAMLATAGQDVTGNSPAKYYNPPVLVAESSGNGESVEERIKRLRNKNNN